MATKEAPDGSVYWPVDPATGNPLTPEQVAASGLNITGANPNAVVWRGGSRGDNWTPPAYMQTYGNYTGMFPSMGQQVGQALYGTIQGGTYQPPWMQTMLPPRQDPVFDRQRYNPFAAQSFKQVVNPYPLNGRVNLTTPNVGHVQNWSNPFIGAYQGLTGFPTNGPGAGPGTGTTPPPTTPQPPPPQPPPQQPPPQPPPQQPPPQPPPGITPPQPAPPNPNPSPLPYPPVPVTQPGGTVIGTNPGGFPFTPQPSQPNPFQPGLMPSTGMPPGGNPGYPGPNPVLSSLGISPQMVQGLLNYFGGGR